ncbi:MAG TPA: LicD family protein, partial [Bacteroidales bacterium]|nr:LicD family protein [Bacteroidales bacterium]
MLRDTANILDRCGIDYVLEAGTLLGVVREHRLLPWDNDIDITITKQFQEKLLKNRWRFWLKGYRTRVKYYKKSMGPFEKGEVRMMKLQKIIPFKKLNLVDIF